MALDVVNVNVIAGLDVGQRVRVKLLSVDVDRGFIDFQKM